MEEHQPSKRGAGCDSSRKLSASYRWFASGPHAEERPFWPRLEGCRGSHGSRRRKRASSPRGSCGHITRHFQKPAKPDPPATQRLAVGCIMRKPRQNPRDRDRAFKPGQRHAGTLMRTGAEGEMAVRDAADVEVFGVGELSRVAVGGSDT